MPCSTYFFIELLTEATREKSVLEKLFRSESEQVKANSKNSIFSISYLKGSGFWESQDYFQLNIVFT